MPAPQVLSYYLTWDSVGKGQEKRQGKRKGRRKQGEEREESSGTGALKWRSSTRLPEALTSFRLGRGCSRHGHGSQETPAPSFLRPEEISSSDFINKGREVQRGQGTSPRSQSCKVQVQSPCFSTLSWTLRQRDTGSQKCQILTHMPLFVFPLGFCDLKTCKDLPSLFSQG